MDSERAFERDVERLYIAHHGWLKGWLRRFLVATAAASVARIIGKEIVEITGVDESVLKPLAVEASAWCRAFGSSYLLTLPDIHAETLWQQLVATQPSKLTRRQANLEDVFLRLTGASLQ